MGDRVPKMLNFAHNLGRGPCKCSLDYAHALRGGGGEKGGGVSMIIFLIFNAF